VDIAKVIVGMSIEIKADPRPGFGILAADIGELLNAPGAYVTEPKRYFLLSDLKPENREYNKNILNKYRATLAFIKILERSSAFLDKDKCSLIFIKDGKYGVPVKYSRDDLKDVDLDIISKFSSFIPKGIHEKTCGKIMAESVIKTTQNQPISERFKYLLQNLYILKECYENSYELYASGFSYEKIKNDIESAKVDFSEKIHAVLAGIQNQILGIPLSSIIIATQMEDSSNSADQLLVNKFVLTGSIIFAIIMGFMVKNQFDTLLAIENEVQRQQKGFRLLGGEFGNAFDFLEERIKYQRCVLRIIIYFICAIFALASIAYLCFSHWRDP
jgi:hypothetical protein